jgi:N,N'-diacetyllegionaminate synthase
MRVLCVIPARGGSKGLVRKNLRHIGGTSLLGRAAIAACQFARTYNGARLIVDTDSEEIAREARAWGVEVPFLRAPELARDNTTSAASTVGLLDRCAMLGEEFEALILLQPTSPLRTADDIALCWSIFNKNNAHSVASLTEEDHPSALAVTLGADRRVEWAYLQATDGIRRQDLPKTYRLSGAVYITTPETLRRESAFVVPGRTIGVAIPRERSVDVDRIEDLTSAEAMLQTQPPRSVSIDQWTIGEHHPCFVIAEAGVNHNGDVSLAHRLIDSAAQAGAHAVKFQTFDPELLVADFAPKAGYQVARTGSSDTQRQMLDALALPREAFRELAAHARERGILFLSTPFDRRSAEFLRELGCAAMKVASGEVTNHRLLSDMARMQIPLLMSTGMSTMAEVSAAVEIIRSNGAPALALFHCVTNYPADPADCNLLTMDAMRLTFGVPVGWSDHTMGIAVAIAAAGLGADMIEKHLTLDRSMPGPDHAASLEPAEFAEMVAGIRVATDARGSAVKRPANSEITNIRVVRRSLHAAREIPEGTPITPADIVALRPGDGLSPTAESSIIGRATTRAVRKGEMLRDDDVR